MRKATALTLVLVVMIIVGLGTTAILQTMISYSQMRIAGIAKTKAEYLAEAGVQYGIWQCRGGDLTSPITITTEEWPILITKTRQPDGSYEVSAAVQYSGM